MAKKFIISLKGKLITKYGTTGLIAVEGAVNQLITSDGVRGITTSLIYLDDVPSAGQFGFPLMSTVTEQGCKNTIDFLYHSQNPDYLVILGAGDVFPFQSIVNPVYQPGKDADQTVPSDFPYACDAPYNNAASAFTNPTRVIGRIPDLPKSPGASSDSSYITGVIQDIINFVPSDAASYTNYFGVSAAIWTASSNLTARNAFGDYSSLIYSPIAAGGYAAGVLSPQTHFYNCHGALLNAKFYGDDGNKSNPVCLSVADINGAITPGTIVAAECCYGAQLLDPGGGPGIGIASSFLKNHAVGFLGSSCISYGVPQGQKQADIICQSFLQNVLGGASLGRALLQARQYFLSGSSGQMADPVAFKTLAQFHLLGDPSIQPVATLESKSFSTTLAGRRIALQANGTSLGFSVGRPNKTAEHKAKKLPPEISELIRQLKLGRIDTEQVYEIEDSLTDALYSKQSLISSQASKPAMRFRVYQKENKHQDLNNSPIRSLKILVVKESGGHVLQWSVYESK